MDDTPVLPHVSREFTIYGSRVIQTAALAAVLVDGYIGQIAEKPAEYRGFAFLYEDRARVEDMVVRALYWAFALGKPVYRPARILSTSHPSSIPTLQARHQITVANDMRYTDRYHFQWTIDLQTHRTYDD